MAVFRPPSGKTWTGTPVSKIPVIPPKKDFESISATSDVAISASGLSSLEQTLLSMGQACMDAAGYEMEAIGKEVIVAAKILAPVKTGTLEDSGQSDDYDPTRKFTLSQIAMWFGEEVGPEATEHGIQSAHDYALVQHEDLSFKHPLKGQAKYLEIPFMQMQPTFLPRIAAAVGRAMGSGAGLPMPFVSTVLPGPLRGISIEKTRTIREPKMNSTIRTVGKPSVHPEAR